MLRDSKRRGSLGDWNRVLWSEIYGRDCCVVSSPYVYALFGFMDPWGTLDDIDCIATKTSIWPYRVVLMSSELELVVHVGDSLGFGCLSWNHMRMWWAVWKSEDRIRGSHNLDSLVIHCMTVVELMSPWLIVPIDVRGNFVWWCSHYGSTHVQTMIKAPLVPTSQEETSYQTKQWIQDCLAFKYEVCLFYALHFSAAHTLNTSFV